MATGLEIFVDRKETCVTIDHPIIFFGFVKYGYSWVFPNKEKLVVGLGGLNIKNEGDFLELFYNFLSVLKFKHLTTFKVAGYPVPYGNFLLNPVLSNVLLVGDAAGFVDPILGEGIFYAHRTAELASLAIYENAHYGKNLSSCYLELLWRYIYPHLVYAKKFRRFIFGSVNEELQYYPVKLVLRLFGKSLIELVHGIRTYRWLRGKK